MKNSLKFTLTATLLAGTLALAGCGAPNADAFGLNIGNPSASDAGATAESADGGVGANQGASITQNNGFTGQQTAAVIPSDAVYADLAAVIGQSWNAADETLINLDATSGTLTITQAGTYRLTGTKTDGGVVIDVSGDELVRVILDNAHITNPAGSPFGAIDADGATALVLAAGSVNSLTDAASYADTSDEAPDSTVYADDDLVIFGSGTLNIQGNFNRGINAKDGIVIDQATINIQSTDDGIRGKDYLVILGGDINIVTGDDGLNSNNVTDNAPVGQVVIAGGNLTIDAQDDAITAEASVTISGGNVNITRSYEGIEGAQVFISGGVINIVSSDDGVNAASNYTNDLGITISGGSLTVTADGDGIDSNGFLLQTGGDVIVHGPTGRGDGSLDADRGVTLDGGTMFAVGSAGMLVSPQAASAQGWLVAPLNQTLPAGTTIAVASETGNIATLVTTREVAAVTYSGPAIVSGSSYTITADGATVATVTAGQAAAGGRGLGGRGGQMPGDGQMPNMPDGASNPSQVPGQTPPQGNTGRGPGRR